VKKVVVVLCVCLLASCTPPGRTTGKGTALGAAVGAGVGGIVGSSVGDPGAGFLIGGATGAASGAAVGNLVQLKDEQIASRDEEIARQQRLISTQERELLTLRAASRDQVVFNSPATSATNYSASSATMGTSAPLAAGTTSATLGTQVADSSMSGFAPRFDNKPIPVGTGSGTIASQPSFSSGNANAVAPLSIASSQTSPSIAPMAGVSPSAPLQVSPAPTELAFNKTPTADVQAQGSMPADARFSARLEPISRGYFGGTKTSSAVSTGVKVTESKTPLYTKTAETTSSLNSAAKMAENKATEIKAAAPVVSAVKEEAITASTTTAASEKPAMSTYSTNFQPGAFALGDSATSTPASSNALSFSRLEDMKSKSSAPISESVKTEVKEAVQTSAPVETKLKVEEPKAIVAPDVEPVADVEKHAPQRLSTTDIATPECRDAAAEINSANMASELADKLFHYRRALRLCPTNSQFHAGLANVYLALDRRDDARFELEEALRLNPTNAEAKAQLDKLK
jgi:Flp pilus assembly protein TadD